MEECGGVSNGNLASRLEVNEDLSIEFSEILVCESLDTSIQTC